MITQTARFDVPPEVPGCAVCGREAGDGSGWFLVVENSWLDRLKILHWHPTLAEQGGMRSVCCKLHLKSATHSLADLCEPAIRRQRGFPPARLNQRWDDRGRLGYRFRSQPGGRVGGVSRVTVERLDRVSAGAGMHPGSSSRWPHSGVAAPGGDGVGRGVTGIPNTQAATGGFASLCLSKPACRRLAAPAFFPGASVPGDGDGHVSGRLPGNAASCFAGS